MQRHRRRSCGRWRRCSTGYGHDPAVTARVDSLELWFIPVLNVDGHGYVFSGAANWDQWRKTLRDNNDNGQVDFPVDGVDLNRNWDWFWQECDDDQPADDYYKGPAPWSEPETVALRDFVLAERPLVVVDYHSPATISWTSIIFYPWISTHGWGHSPDYDDRPRDRHGLGRRHAERDRTTPTARIFGYDTLPKEQNWIYGRTGILAFEMEISDHCWWTGAVVDTIAARVARGSAYLLDRTLTGPGITGRVTDAVTGAAAGRRGRARRDALGARRPAPDRGRASASFYRLTGERHLHGHRQPPRLREPRPATSRWPATPGPPPTSPSFPITTAVGRSAAVRPRAGCGPPTRCAPARACASPARRPGPLRASNCTTCAAAAWRCSARISRRAATTTCVCRAASRRAPICCGSERRRSNRSFGSSVSNDVGRHARDDGDTRPKPSVARIRRPCRLPLRPAIRGGMKRGGDDMGETTRNRGWQVAAAGTGINLALGVLYTWSIFKVAIKESDRGRRGVPVGPRARSTTPTPSPAWSSPSR